MKKKWYILWPLGIGRHAGILLSYGIGIFWPFGILVAIWYIFPRLGELCKENSGNTGSDAAFIIGIYPSVIFSGFFSTHQFFSIWQKLHFFVAVFKRWRSDWLQAWFPLLATIGLSARFSQNFTK
jgi:hypothetical protein